MFHSAYNTADRISENIHSEHPLFQCENFIALQKRSNVIKESSKRIFRKFGGPPITFVISFEFENDSHAIVRECVVLA